MYNFTQQGPLASEQPPKKSILDSVLERLYPSGAYGGLLPDDLLHDDRMMALRHAGLSLMAAPASIPGEPPHTFGSDLATALDPAGWQQQLGQTAQTALALHGASRKLQDEQMTDAILARHPVKTNASPQEQEQRLRDLAQEFQAHGLWEPAQVAAGMIDKLRPEPLKEHNDFLVDPRTGQPVAKLPPKAQTVEGSQVWSNAVGQLAPWEKVKSTVDRYALYREAPPTPASNQALVAAASELLTTHGGYPDEKSALDHVPLLGELIQMIRALAGKTNLKPEERQDLIETTDKVVGQLAESYGQKRADVERLMGGTSTNPLFKADEIPALLPARITWPTFTPGAKNARPKQPGRREGFPY